MIKLTDELKTLQSIAKTIAKQFGDKCEVVLHDFSNGYDNSIVAIENGHITGRKIGSSITNTGLENLKRIQDSKMNPKDGFHNYMTITKDGKTLRSSSSIITNDQGEVIGSLCINFDITDFILASNTMKQMIEFETPTLQNEVFVNDVNELFDIYLKECIKHVGKPIALMQKEDKIKAISYLDQKGAFLITKSGKRVCEMFGISKYTLYNYLDEIRNQQDK
ncbi:helix-turn-helix transcriptional regulator [Anaeromicrobium sediminis]|uniref:Transcriptional regulator n=1 Tax=Anaeromicrobium sediminis TaxID=1478221 RepID=A0A267MDT4_9FIRM|nr:helix-turn-helix transcriptional regulator [Anaeromicrobium sediminis]PAB57025.1 hypothetical protein CCE28_19795 [Anaeromicrobium sediminis]